MSTVHHRGTENGGCRGAEAEGLPRTAITVREKVPAWQLRSSKRLAGPVSLYFTAGSRHCWASCASGRNAGCRALNVPKEVTGLLHVEGTHGGSLFRGDGVLQFHFIVVFTVFYLHTTSSNSRLKWGTPTDLHAFRMGPHLSPPLAYLVPLHSLRGLINVTAYRHCRKISLCSA